MTKTCSAKNRESVAPAMMGPPSSMMHRVLADERSAAGDGSADAQPPIGILIEAQDLSGEGHAESHQQQKDADDPGQLAGKFVGAEEKTWHMWISTTATMKLEPQPWTAAQKPSQGDIVIQILQTVPGFGRRGHINQRQQNAGENLQDEDGKRGAAEDIPPARGFARDRMRNGFANRAADLQALLEPVADAASALTSAFPRRQAGGGG